MGTEITTERFGAHDYARFRERLEQCLTDLGRLLERHGFGAGPATVGAELELFLVDGAAQPLPRNEAIRALAADPRIAVELNRFNLELNASPVLLAGRPFTALGRELELLLAQVGDAARVHQGRIALIGVLPTLTQANLDASVVTDTARYRALGRGLQRLRGGPVHIRIAGAEPLELTSEGIALEGANTSFQVHLRVAPPDFTRFYNAVRIEMRALPAGPTVTDMLANAAFLIGLTWWLAEKDQQWTYALPFERAEHGFYRAAQYGLAAELSWPAGRGDQVRTLPAADLLTGLLPAARQGLLAAGVAAAEADSLLSVIGTRVATGQTGAAWQRATLAALQPGRSRPRALAAMLDRYLSCAASGQPVHTWPIGDR